MKKQRFSPIFFSLWLLVALGWSAGAHAQQVLVSNLGQADFATASPIASLLGVFDHAQQFTTGSNSAGYRLNSVEIEFGRLDAGFPFSVSIRTNASGSPGTVVGTLANPSYTAFTTDTVLKFTAAGDGIALAASTSYFLVLDVTGDSGSNFATWRVTTSMSEDSGGASGWSIADLHRLLQNVADAAWVNNVVTSTLKIRINGSAVTLPTVTIARVATPVTEGAAARFTVSRTGATTAALAVQVSVSENSAGGQNFVASTNEGTKSVSIPMGSASAVYSVATVGDAIDEPDGAVTVTVASGSGYSVGSPSTASVTVNDDDLPVVTITSGASSVTEGTAASFTVTRAGLTTAALTVNVNVADVAGSDFVASDDEGADTVTIQAGQASAAYSVATVADSVVEASGNVIVTVSTGTGYTVGSPPSANVMVNDDDTAAVLINGADSNITLSVGEDRGTATYTIRLDSQPSHSVTVTVSSATDTAARVNKAGGSAGKTQTLTFTPSGTGAWNVAQTITVTGVNNTSDDANNRRTSLITHTAASSDANYSGITPIPTVTVTVTDDDTPELTVSAQGGVTTVNENGAAATIIVTSNIQVDGSIDYGQPSVSTGGAVSADETTIAGGNTSNTYTVSASDNNRDEADWSITTGIAAGTGYTLGSPSAVMLTVRDDDPTVVSLAGGGRVFEGEGTTFTVTLGRDLAAGEIIDVPLAITGAGITPSDWRLALASGMGLNTGVTLNDANTATPQLRFAGAGARTATLTLTAEAGSGGKTIRVELGPDGSGANGFDRSGLGTNVGGGANPHATALRIMLVVTADTVVNDRDFLAFVRAPGETSASRRTEGSRLTLSVHRIAFTSDNNNLHTPDDWGFRLCFTGAATPGADFSVSHGGGRTSLDQEGCTRTNSAEDGTALPARLSVARFYIKLLHDDLDEGDERVVATLTRTINTGVSGQGLSEFRFTISEPPLIDKVRHYITEIWHGYDHVLRWQRVLFALSDGSEGEGPAMTAAEAQDYANRGMTRWVPVAAALSPLQTQSASPDDEIEGEAPADDDTPSDSETPVEPVEAQDAFVPDAALIANIRAWRSETHHGQAHVDRWTRVLIAFKVETGSLAPMSATEAQTYADKGWTRWEPVVAALKAMQADMQQEEAAASEQDDAPPPTPALSVSDASGAEGATMKFTITLSPAATDTVNVWVSTRESQPVSAQMNRDYQHNGWWLTFKPGETEKHRWIYAFDDAHEDSGETFEFALSRARGAVIADAVGIGTITNDDPLPAAYLARFGRTVAEQALGGIAARMEAPRERGLQGNFAGYSLSFGTSVPDTEGHATAHGEILTPIPSTGFADDRHGRDHGPQGLTLRDALLASSFSLTSADGVFGGSAALWGRSSQGRFAGRDGGLALDGETSTSMLGADYARGRWLAGLAVAVSASEGNHHVSGAAGGEGDGQIETSLTAVLPYASMQVSERFKVWGALGSGVGEVRLAPALGGSYRADTFWRMAAAGLRGELMPATDAGPALVIVSDAMWAQTRSEDAPSLGASDAAVTGFKFGLEGSWQLSTANGARFVPRLEAGLRHDGGDAETGLGVELGGGLSWSAPALGLILDLAGRSLLTHEDNGFKDEGISISLAFDPAPTTHRGLSFTLRQDYGSRSQGGLDALFASAPLAYSAASEAAGRWTMEAAWGVPVFGGRFTGSPHAGFGRSGLARDFRLGWRLVSEAESAQHLSFGLQAMRQESGMSRPEHMIGLEASLRW